MSTSATGWSLSTRPGLRNMAREDRAKGELKEAWIMVYSVRYCNFRSFIVIL